MVLHKGTVGVAVIPVSFEIWFVEWPAERGAGSGPIDRHRQLPPEAAWKVVEKGRKACVLPNGHRIERTLYANCLIGGEPATLALRSTAFPLGQNFARAAEKIVVKVDGVDFRMIGAKWLLGSRLEVDGSLRWFVPTFKFVGKLGETTGPSLAEVRQARDLRIGLKTEAAALAAPVGLEAKLTALAARPSPAIEPPRPRETGKRDYSTPRDEPPPPTQCAGPNDSLDDINF
jgi:hypothetical protein